MRIALCIVCAVLLSSCATHKSTPEYTGVLYLDRDISAIDGSRLVLSIDRLEDVQESFDIYAKFAYLNGVETIQKHVLIDEHIITLDETATLVYAKIQDIERERINQNNLKEIDHGKTK